MWEDVSGRLGLVNIMCLKTESGGVYQTTEKLPLPAWPSRRSVCKGTLLSIFVLKR